MGKLLNQIDIVLSITTHWIVSDIVLDGHWCLKDGNLLQVWHHIRQRAVPDIRAQETDTWCWSLTKTGDFTFSSVWNLVRDHGEKFPFFNLIWYPNHSPKMSLCLLRALKVKLPTRSFLKSHNIIDRTDTCTLCNQSSESLQHLFFDCPFSSYIWSLCKLKLGITDVTMVSFQMEADKLQKHFKKKKIKAYFPSQNLL